MKASHEEISENHGKTTIFHGNLQHPLRRRLTVY